SELSHVRVGHPSEVVNVGDTVEVEVLRIEPPNPHSPDKAKHKERITLSMRARQEDPWKAFAAGLKEADRLQGKVVRRQPFGAFAELRPGVDGLIHISAMSERRIAHPRDVLKIGETVEVAVEKVDAAEKRIGLRLVGAGGPGWWARASRWEVACPPRHRRRSPCARPRRRRRPHHARERARWSRARWIASSPTACSWCSPGDGGSCPRARPGPSGAPTSSGTSSSVRP